MVASCILQAALPHQTRQPDPPEEREGHAKDAGPFSLFGGASRWPIMLHYFDGKSRVE